MKKWLLFSLLNVVIANCFAQDADIFYKVFTGKIGSYNATLHITSSKQKLNGWIWLDEYAKPVQLYTDEQLEDSVHITAGTASFSLEMIGLLSYQSLVGRANIELGKDTLLNQPMSLRLSLSKSFTPLDWVYVKGSASRSKNSTEGPTASYYSGIVWPRKSTSADVPKYINTLKHALNSNIKNKKNMSEPGLHMLQAKNQFLARWKADMAKLSAKEKREAGVSYSQEMEKTIQVMYEDEKTITLASFDYEFTGGAHGNYITETININKTKGSVFMLQDVLTSEGIKKLPAILDSIVRANYSFDASKSLEENGLFMKTLEPSQNFYFTKGGIGFIYSTYSILPYVAGEPNLFIPYQYIAPYLLSYFKYE